MSRQILDKKTWTSLRKSLNSSYDYKNKNWEKVISLFENRVNDFYFKPIDQILKLNKQGEGFSILTLQCALIEMFAAFRQGKIHNHNRPKKKEIRPKYEYYNSDDCFIKFLETEEIFENIFYIKDEVTGEKKPNPVFSAKEFYGKVRCGLMHEARTKEDWLITASYSKKFTETIFIVKNEDNTKSINRTILNKRLKTYFEEIYLTELKAESPEGSKLRRLFARKLDHLHDIKCDLKYDWWTYKKNE
jgi:hypothetical protein